jgi:hypothetical protein
MMRFLALAMLFAAAGCTSDSYPLPSGPGSSVTARTKIGMSVPTVVIFMEPRPGDRIEFVSAEPVGTLGDTDVRFHFSPPVINADGSRTVGEKLEQLAGASVTIDRNASPGPENTVGIVAELTPRSAGTFTLANVRLHYRLNGGSEQVKEGVSVVFTICAADPAPADCEASPAP